MSSVVEDKKRVREEEEEESSSVSSNNINNNNSTDNNNKNNNNKGISLELLPRHKKKKQIESKKWLSSRARKPRVGTDFQVNIASIPAFERKKVSDSDNNNNIKKSATTDDV